jgi:hemerythrin
MLAVRRNRASKIDSEDHGRNNPDFHVKFQIRPILTRVKPGAAVFHYLGIAAGDSTMQKTSDLIWQDTQHQMLFRLIEQIKQVPFDPDILVQLRFYAEHHFRLEEAYMKALDYPHTDGHIEAHDRFREELKAMMETDPTMHESLQVSLSDFLYKWLKLHVLGIDKQLEEFILNSSSK